MRVYAVSDIHADYEENLAWIHSLSEQQYQEDVLILAGDVSDDMATLAAVFDSLRSRFREVMFVPGNHELWVQREDYDCSLRKFEAVNSLCADHGIRTGPAEIGGTAFVPLLGWYDYSFAEPERKLRLGWRDFKACRWPSHLDSCTAINDHFLSLNESLLDINSTNVISYSHFVPGLAVMPPRIPQSRRTVYPVLGSEKLGEQVRRLGPDIHVYGHSHVNQSVEIDGIRYINNAFAYPSEQRIARKQLHCVFQDNGDRDHVA